MRWWAVCLLVVWSAVGQNSSDAAPEDSLEYEYVVQKGITKCTTSGALGTPAPTNSTPPPPVTTTFAARTRTITLPAPSDAGNGGNDGLATTFDIFLSTDAASVCPKLPLLPYIVDGMAEVIPSVGVCLPAFALWCLAWVAMGKLTRDDGYVDIPRAVESDYVTHRYIMTACFMLTEFPQLVAVSFNSAMEAEYHDGMKIIGSIFRPWLLYFHGPPQKGIFAMCVVAVWVLGIIIYLPMVFVVFLPHKYENFIQRIPEHIVPALEILRDLYMYYMTLPVLIVLINPLFCTYYAKPPNGLGEAATMNWNKDVECWSTPDHKAMVAVGVITFCVYYVAVLVCGMIPFMVSKSTDLWMHGRYTAISIQWKVWLAITFCVFEPRWRWPHIVAVSIAVSWYWFFTVTIRPCPIERVNFLRSASMPLAIWACLCALFVAGMDDPTATSPFVILVVGWALLVGVAAIRYYLIPDQKVFPPIEVEGGWYEGSVSLGLLCRHGMGTQTWADNAEYRGHWLFGEIDGNGVFRLPNKMFYEGKWKRGKRNGHGKTTIMPPGEVEYEGLFKDDEFHGFGIKIFADREKYEGWFKNGKEHGEGTWTFTDGRSLKGKWVNGTVKLKGQDDNTKDNVFGVWRYGVPHGKAEKTYKDGGRYDGIFCAGKRHLEGHMVYKDGSEYMGSWLDDMRHGSGYYETPEGVRYDGDWKQGVMDGYGVLTLPSGEVYEGNFKNGERKGFGACRYPDGRVYKGSWGGKSALDGIGMMIYPEGDEYDGPWRKGLRHGNPGVYRFPDGTEYNGEFDKDVMHGEATLHIVNVGTYKGEFRDGKRRGLGKFEWEDGSLYEGEWVDNAPQGRGVLAFRTDLTIAMLLRASKVYTPLESLPPTCTDLPMNIEAPVSIAGSSDDEGSAPSNGEDQHLLHPSTTQSGQADELTRNGTQQDAGVVQNGEGVGDFPSEAMEAGFPAGPPPVPPQYSDALLSEPSGPVEQQPAVPQLPPPMAMEGLAEYEQGRPASRDGGQEEQGRWSPTGSQGGQTLPAEDFPEGPPFNEELGLEVPVLAGVAGGKYDGEWYAGNMQGRGTMVFADGSKYIGLWVMNRMEGKGVRFYADGGRYEGQWVDGRRHGRGQMVYSDQREYTGQWYRDLRQGGGVLRHPNGKELKGFWRHDMFVGPTIDDYLKTEDLQSTIAKRYQEASEPRKSLFKSSGAVEWEQHHTADGTPYYQNVITGSICWTRPPGFVDSSAAPHDAKNDSSLCNVHPFGESAQSTMASPEGSHHATGPGGGHDAQRDDTAKEQEEGGAGEPAALDEQEDSSPPQPAAAIEGHPDEQDDREDGKKGMGLHEEREVKGDENASPRQLEETPTAEVEDEKPTAEVKEDEKPTAESTDAVPGEDPYAGKGNEGEPVGTREAVPLTIDTAGANQTDHTDQGTPAEETTEGGDGEEKDKEKDPNKERRVKLTRQLNAWKKQYAEEHGKEPTKRDIRSDPSIAEVYEEYLALRAEKGRRSSGGKADTPQRKKKRPRKRPSDPAAGGATIPAGAGSGGSDGSGGE